jgi:hypothetical protein
MKSLGEELTPGAVHLQSGTTSMMDMKVASDNVNWKAPWSLNEVVGKEWEGSQLIVAPQFKVLDIGFYVCTFIQSSSDSKSNTKCIPDTVRETKYGLT